MSSFTDSERHPSLTGWEVFDMTKQQTSVLPIFWVKCSRSLPQTTKIIFITRFIRQFHVFSWKQKASMFIKIKCKQTGNSSCYLKNGGGWGLSTALLLRQLHVISICLYNVLLASSISSQPQWDLTGNYPVHRSALQKLLSCMYCVHSYLRKNFPQILPHWLTTEYHTKSSKDKNLSYSCRAIQQALAQGITRINTSLRVFFSEQRLQ